ncbi:hypothetical protein O6H91_04G129800 [Diphasiastrum complanatum]|uniref:Uncharacterized protein n=1 Tax=Diphasiastrum complanatum TaxID=34168 RepID=A0ACC2E2E5_DIPCM|nr:hypothetical protein O6H91_04G129800 [Diphasiastrum complanatum]
MCERGGGGAHCNTCPPLACTSIMLARITLVHLVVVSVGEDRKVSLWLGQPLGTVPSNEEAPHIVEVQKFLWNVFKVVDFWLPAHLGGQMYSLASS